MASTTVALVYSAATGRLRWWLVPDDDSQIASFQSSNAGEAVVVVSRTQYENAGGVVGLQALVNAASGKSPVIEDRYVDIDAGGNVALVAFACPNCGDAPAAGFTRVLHATATPGSFFVGSTCFTPRIRARKRGRYRRLRQPN